MWCASGASSLLGSRVKAGPRTLPTDMSRWRRLHHLGFALRGYLHFDVPVKQGFAEALTPASVVVPRPVATYPLYKDRKALQGQRAKDGS